MENPLILCVGFPLLRIDQVLPVLELAKQTGQSLIVAASDVDGEVLETMLKNNGQQELLSCAINFPGGVEDWNLEYLADLAAFTGASYITEESQLRLCQLKDLGSCKRVNIDGFQSIFFGGAGDISARCGRLQYQLEHSTGDEASIYRERLQRLEGKMAVLEVGCKGGTTEMQERRDRMVDALNSVKSALTEGVVPGGGTACFYAGRQLKAHRSPSTAHGVRIVAEALQVPLKSLVENGGLGLSLLDTLQECLDEDVGVNVITGGLENMLEAGIIDSAHVVLQAVETACSIGGMVLSAETAVVRQKQYTAPALSTYKKDIF
jgi:chaperonin GroEL